MKLNASRVDGVLQRTEKWLECRKGRLSGSSIACITGRNRYKTSEQLLQDMLAELTGTAVAEKPNADMQRGVDWEDEILRQGLCDEFGADLAAEVRETDTFWLDERADICYSPDGLLETGGRRWLVEVKAPRRIDTVSTVPEKHIDQLSLGMEMLGCDGAVYIQGQVQDRQLVQLRSVRIGKSPHWWNRVYPGVRAFQQQLQRRLKSRL